MSFPRITHLGEIKEEMLEPDSLILLDIDETIMGNRGETSFLYDPDLPDLLFDVKESGNKIVCLTARPGSLENQRFTHQNLQDVGLFPFIDRYIFCGNLSKGFCLNRWLQKFPQFGRKNKIFVDDLVHNLKSVVQEYPETQSYLIKAVSRY